MRPMAPEQLAQRTAGLPQWTPEDANDPPAARRLLGKPASSSKAVPTTFDWRSKGKVGRRLP